MMEKCYDEGTLQAFLDNELSQEMSQRVARHLVDCDPCAILLAEVEEETAFAFAALEQEFNTLVPTQRLWTKINESIESQGRRKSIWQHVLTFVSSLSFSNPHVIAFGSLLLIVGVVSTLILIKGDKISDNNNIAGVNRPEVPKVERAKINELTPPVTAPSNEVVPDQVENPVEDSTKSAPAPQYRIERANFVKSEAPRRPSSNTSIDTPKPDAPQYLDGEESYVKTIARLEQSANQSKDEVLKPSERFSYEKDLAVVTSTIDKMKKEVRKNPKNESAKQILFASYQNKIELLNSVTQRGELMASLR